MNNLLELGFTMNNIRAEGKCPKCGGRFRRDNRYGFVCPTCLTTPRRFLIDFRYKGDRIRRGTTFDGKTLSSFAEAHALLMQAQAEIRAHKFDPTRWKSKDRLEFRFDYLIDRFYETKKTLMDQGKLAPSYVPKLRTYIELYLKPYFGLMDVREINSVLIEDFYLKLGAWPSRKLSLKYQKNIMDALRHFFKTLKEKRVIDDIPSFPGIEVPEHEPVTISYNIQRMILEYIPDEHKPIFVFLFNQGCRPSEVRALKIKDIDLETQSVTYRRTWSGEVLRETTKTKRIRHNILFPETLTAIMPLIKGRFPEDFLFVHGKTIKRHYSRSLLDRIYNNALRRIKEEKNIEIKSELYEATKHSFGTSYGNAGVNLDVLQKWFGHTSKKTTEKYARLKVIDVFKREFLAEKNNQRKSSY